MSDTVITVENLSKHYLVGHEGPQERYQSLRDTIVRHGKSFFRKGMEMARGNQIIQGDTVEEFWALKDVSFEVKRGEVLGIIGRNGAGKSTLLKILSRITEPTSGRVTLQGRVSSLLEVGTGFHPELTGRENIFLNGAILGMRREEIKAKFDEIVAFAEVEKFLDTPVKRYSSGMYVRLAFAVAAHLEPEILIVDEVLAVGDSQFQKKCMGKMQDVAKGGRTVLFVSHNLPSVTTLCTRALLLSSGRLIEHGAPLEIVDLYEKQGAQNQEEDGWEHLDDDLKIKLIEFQAKVQSGTEFHLVANLTFNECVRIKGLALILSTLIGTRVAVVDLRTALVSDSFTQARQIRIEVTLPSIPLVEGLYSLNWHIESSAFTRDIATDWQMEVTASDYTLRTGAYLPSYRGHLELSSASKMELLES